MSLRERSIATLIAVEIVGYGAIRRLIDIAD
jgi:hypothetical protein